MQYLKLSKQVHCALIPPKAKGDGSKAWCTHAYEITRDGDAYVQCANCLQAWPKKGGEGWKSYMHGAGCAMATRHCCRRHPDADSVAQAVEQQMRDPLPWCAATEHATRSAAVAAKICSSCNRHRELEAFESGKATCVDCLARKKGKQFPEYTTPCGETQALKSILQCLVAQSTQLQCENRMLRGDRTATSQTPVAAGESADEFPLSGLEPSPESGGGIGSCPGNLNMAHNNTAVGFGSDPCQELGLLELGLQDFLTGGEIEELLAAVNGDSECDKTRNVVGCSSDPAGLDSGMVPHRACTGENKRKREEPNSNSMQQRALDLELAAYLDGDMQSDESGSGVSTCAENIAHNNTAVRDESRAGSSISSRPGIGWGSSSACSVASEVCTILAPFESPNLAWALVLVKTYAIVLLSALLFAFVIFSIETL